MDNPTLNSTSSRERLAIFSLVPYVLPRMRRLALVSSAQALNCVTASKSAHFQIFSLLNPFTSKSFHFQICSLPNPFTSKSFRFQICSLPNPFTSKSFRFQICSLANPFSSKLFRFQICSLPNPFTSKSIFLCLLHWKRAKSDG